MTGDLRPPGRATLTTLALLMGFASIATDLYLSAMPTMARALGASSGAMAFTIAGFLLGFAVGQPLWGPVSDRHGRRVPLMIGLCLFMRSGERRPKNVRLRLARNTISPLASPRR